MTKRPVHILLSFASAACLLLASACSKHCEENAAPHSQTSNGGTRAEMVGSANDDMATQKGGTHLQLRDATVGNGDQGNDATGISDDGDSQSDGERSHRKAHNN